MADELVVVEPANIPALFKKDGCDPILKRLHEELDKFEPNITTAKGRKEIASFASKFSKAKTLIDGHGKALVEDEKIRLKIVDAERKKFRDECDVMKIEARKPLTDWENAEKQRVADIEERINAITRYGEGACSYESSVRVKIDMDELREIAVDNSFEEFELAATKAKEAALTQLEAKFIVLQDAEKKKVEADRIEKERLAEEQKDREEKIAKEAAEKATRDAEEKSRLEGVEKDRLAKEAIEKAKKETLEAKLATEKADREKKEAAAKVDQDKKDAIWKADKEKDDAVKAETKRIADEAEAKRIEDEKLAKNKAHRGKINREAKQSFIDEGVGPEVAEHMIKLIAKRKIANITINY